jgi:hypothetical protein
MRYVVAPATEVHEDAAILGDGDAGGHGVLEGEHLLQPTHSPCARQIGRGGFGRRSSQDGGGTQSQDQNQKYDGPCGACAKSAVDGRPGRAQAACLASRVVRLRLNITSNRLAAFASAPAAATQE